MDIELPEEQRAFFSPARRSALSEQAESAVRRTNARECARQAAQKLADMEPSASAFPANDRGPCGLPTDSVLVTRAASRPKPGDMTHACDLTPIHPLVNHAPGDGEKRFLPGRIRNS